jgi:hypothetical protein
LEEWWETFLPLLELVVEFVDHVWKTSVVERYAGVRGV